MVKAVYRQYHRSVVRLRDQSDIKVCWFRSPGKKDNMQKWCLNLQDFKKYVVDRTTFKFYDEEEFPTAKKLALELTK